jgi:glyoxylase-like metal-dependent hydrolase (beta-lactamase superfamily II)/8-oxo-dGTP pyrophosphatase MutT (NUDIX family)
MSLYEDVLRAGAGAPGAPGASGGAPKPPRDSAAVVPWRRSASGDLEVFWVRRSDELAFMGGWYAFPGGAKNRDDATLEDTAVRELHEETGLAVSGGRLVPAGRWLTPPLGPMRFDNRFFLLEWPAREPEQPVVAPGELAFGEWIAPAIAFERWRSGEVLAAPPVLHFLRVLAEDGPERGLARLADPAEAFLGRLLAIEFRPGYLVFPLATRTLPPATHTNAVVVGTRRALLIDPGSDDARELELLFEALHVARERRGVEIGAIVLTHHHPDHVAGVAAARAALGVPVWAHAATAERLATFGLSVDRELRDGEPLVLPGGDVGGDVDAGERVLTVVETPGHARGHLVFHDAAARVLVGGDLVSALSTIVIDPPEGDLDDYLASLERAAALDATLLIPAHGTALLDPPKVLRKAIAHRLWREEKLLAAWAGGLRSLDELVPVVYDDAPAFLHPLAARQLTAHLERLRRAGRLRED